MSLVLTGLTGGATEWMFAVAHLVHADAVVLARRITLLSVGQTLLNASLSDDLLPSSCDWITTAQIC